MIEPRLSPLAAQRPIPFSQWLIEASCDNLVQNTHHIDRCRHRHEGVQRDHREQQRKDADHHLTADRLKSSSEIIEKTAGMALTGLSGMSCLRYLATALTGRPSWSLQEPFQRYPLPPAIARAGESLRKAFRHCRRPLTFALAGSRCTSKCMSVYHSHLEWKKGRRKCEFKRVRFARDLFLKQFEHANKDLISTARLVSTSEEGRHRALSQLCRAMHPTRRI